MDINISACLLNQEIQKIDTEFKAFFDAMERLHVDAESLSECFRGKAAQELLSQFLRDWQQVYWYGMEAAKLIQAITVVTNTFVECETKVFHLLEECVK